MTNVADEALGKLARQWNDLFRRVREGTLGADYVSAGMQEIIEGKFSMPFIYLPWTAVDQYASKLRDWNERFGLDLSDKQIDDLDASLPDHAGPYQPTGISLTFGKGLQYDWEVAMKALRYETRTPPFSFAYLSALHLSYFPGSEPAESEKPELSVALLDIGRFWGRGMDGIVPREVCANFRGRPLPGLEVAWLLALNPVVYLRIDGEKIPTMGAPGLVMDDDHLPYFDGGSGVICVNGREPGNFWHGMSVVVFRE